MFRPLPLFIAFRYIYGQKRDGFGYFVFWLSMIGIFLGSLGMIIVLSVMNGLENNMQNSILRFMPQVQITTSANQINIKDYPVERFESLNHITQFTPLVTGDVVIQSEKGLAIATLMGIEPNEYEPIKDYLIWSNIDYLTAGQYNVIIGRQLAEQLGIHVGDNIRLMVTQASQMTPVGRIPSQRLFNVVGLFSVNRDINQSLIYVNMTDAAKLMRYSQDTISSWRGFLQNPLNISDVVSQSLPDELLFKDWRDKRGELFQAVKMEKSMMGLLISLIVIVAAFNIITSLSLLIMEKQSEVAILKTQGLSFSKIMLIFIIQGASSGFIGTLLGSLFGILIADNLNTIMSTLGLTFAGIQLPTMIDVSQILSILIGLLLLSLLSTLYPAYKAAKIQPAEALRYE